MSEMSDQVSALWERCNGELAQVMNKYMGERVEMMKEEEEKKLDDVKELIVGGPELDGEGVVPIRLEKHGEAVCVRIGRRQANYLVSFRVRDGKVVMYRHSSIDDKRVQTDRSGRIEA